TGRPCTAAANAFSDSANLFCSQKHQPGLSWPLPKKGLCGKPFARASNEACACCKKLVVTSAFAAALVRLVSAPATCCRSCNSPRVSQAKSAAAAVGYWFKNLLSMRIASPIHYEPGKAQ